MRPRNVPFLLAGCVALVLAAPPARADLVIDGRGAQALHCAAMLYMVSEELYRAGHVSRHARDNAQVAAITMLQSVPGTDEQRVQAMGIRFEQILQTRSLTELYDEYFESRNWCRREFLDQAP